MSREIKFRAFEKNLKEIIPVDSIDFEKKIINKNGVWRFFDEVELMQDTGIRDKNGKEIYEGYIVKIDGFDDEEDGYFLVKFENESARYILSGNRLVYDFDNIFGNECEIIGNIYENPQLLVGEE